MSGNKLTMLDECVFQSIFQTFASGGFNSTTTFIDASSSEFILYGIKVSINEIIIYPFRSIPEG